VTGMEPGVAPDGSPVALYLAIPGAEEGALIHGAIPDGAAVLELGCGVGRVSEVLADLGHRVMGVDNSAEMLAAMPEDSRIETTLAEIATLDLAPRRWPVVVLASRMINDEQGAAFLATAARHLEPGGVVIVERHVPGWIDTVESTSAVRYGMTMAIRVDGRPESGVLCATMIYDVQEHRYEQSFTAYEVDDARLAELAAGVDLQVDAVLDDDGAWVRLTTTPSA
jgi:SAM-dependent methyltransferase